MTWFIAVTNPNCHRRAENELAALGYRAFWPKMRKWVSHARVKTAKEYPILGRYLFVDIPENEDGDHDFWSVRNINGIEALLTGDRGEPAQVHEGVVFALMRRYIAGEWDLIEKEHIEETDPETGETRLQRNRIPIGARIRIMEGEFADMLVIVRGRKNGRLQFLPPGKRQLVFTREENARAA